MARAQRWSSVRAGSASSSPAISMAVRIDRPALVAFDSTRASSGIWATKAWRWRSSRHDSSDLRPRTAARAEQQRDVDRDEERRERRRDEEHGDGDRDRLGRQHRAEAGAGEPVLQRAAPAGAPHVAVRRPGEQPAHADPPVPPAVADEGAVLRDASGHRPHAQHRYEQAEREQRERGRGTHQLARRIMQLARVQGRAERRGQHLSGQLEALGERRRAAGGG